jgi:hypothetical protein
MNTRRAGTIAAKTAQTGNASENANGFTSQPLFRGAVGFRPSGTSSFYKQTKFYKADNYVVQLHLPLVEHSYHRLNEGNH